MKSNKKILVVSTYPIKEPRHGGQKRTSAIVEAYKQHFIEVQYCAVFFRGFYADYSEADLPLGRESELRATQSPLTGDIVCGEAIYSDPAVKKRFSELLISLAPDIIHIEQPFPYLGIKPLLQELGLRPKIIFGSQNIEAPMKREILENAGVGEPAVSDVEKDISALEQDLSKACDLLVDCTKEDAQAHKNMGAKNVVLAPNGIGDIESTPQDTQFWQNKFDNLGVKKTALFVGSAHPPNWTGFLQMVGKGLGFMPFDTRLVVAGSISDYFDREIITDSQDIEDATFWLRAFSAGRLSESRLGSLINLADVMLLPITEGGGSNLKTAEAITANKKVVATPHALRSFEWFKDFPNVWVADNRITFQKDIQEALQTPFKRRTAQEEKLALQVKWDNCLKEMIKAAGKL